MMFIRVAAPAFALFAVALLAGCAESPGAYPSLAPRPIERTAIEEPAVTPAETAPPIADPAQNADVAAQLAAAEAAQAQFAAELEPARKAIAVAAGQAVGSEAWVVAQQALSRLDQRRGPVTAALANLDAMLVASGGAPSVALGNAWARVARIDEGQRNAWNALAARLRQPPAS
jgi:hypothetical protein